MSSLDLSWTALSLCVPGRKWRTGRDSNPRYRFRHTRFPGVPDRPLRHLSILGKRTFVHAVEPGKQILQREMRSSDRRGRQGWVAAQNGHLFALTEESANGILNDLIFRVAFQFGEERQASGIA